MLDGVGEQLVGPTFHQEKSFLQIESKQTSPTRRKNSDCAMCQFLATQIAIDIRFPLRVLVVAHTRHATLSVRPIWDTRTDWCK